MPRSAAARRYAKALFELARDEDRVAAVRAELGALSGLLAGSEALRKVLLQPLHPVTQRRAVLEAVATAIQASPVLHHFYAYLIDQRRLVDFDSIEAEYGRLADEAAGLVVAHVRTATVLSDAQRERLQRALGARTGQTVQLQVEVDAGLLGGVIAQVGDTVFDSTLRTQLDQLRASLVKG